MRIGLIGYGRMGQIIHRIAEERGHDVTAIIDPQHPDATHRGLDEGVTTDVLIDFSTPVAVRDNIHRACLYRKNIVVGTTGWQEAIESVKREVEQSGNGFLYASNFSPAVQMFFRTVRTAAQIANKLPCDVAGFEAHHKHKVDAPSGTALTMGNILLDEIDRKEVLLLDRPEGKIADNALHLTTLRAGSIPGTHSAIFDFDAETIEVSSISRSREGFALGAVLAAEWLQGKDGFHLYDDIFDEILEK